MRQTRGRAHLKWAQLLRRVFSLDALACPQCQSAMVVLAFISDPPVVSKILGHPKLPTTPPPVAAARGLWEPEPELWIPPMEDGGIEGRDLAGAGEGTQRFVQTSCRHPGAARSPP